MYYIPDFGKSKHDGKIVPLGMKASVETSNDDTKRVCLKLNLADFSNEGDALFPIYRIEDWKDRTQGSIDYDLEARLVLGFAAALYLLLFLYDVSCIVIFFIKKSKFKRFHPIFAFILALSISKFTTPDIFL